MLANKTVGYRGQDRVRPAKAFRVGTMKRLGVWQLLTTTTWVGELQHFFLREIF